MENIFLTQLSVVEIRELFREEMQDFFKSQTIQPQTDEDEIGGIDLAVRITGKAKPTIYSLCSQRAIPHSKRGKSLYFSKKSLLEWINSGKRRTAAEIQSAAGI